MVDRSLTRLRFSICLSSLTSEYESICVTVGFDQH